MTCSSVGVLKRKYAKDNEVFIKVCERPDKTDIARIKMHMKPPKISCTAVERSGFVSNRNGIKKAGSISGNVSMLDKIMTIK